MDDETRGRRRVFWRAKKGLYFAQAATLSAFYRRMLPFLLGKKMAKFYRTNCSCISFTPFTYRNILKSGHLRKLSKWFKVRFVSLDGTLGSKAPTSPGLFLCSAHIKKICSIYVFFVDILEWVSLAN